MVDELNYKAKLRFVIPLFLGWGWGVGQIGDGFFVLFLMTGKRTIKL